MEKVRFMGEKTKIQLSVKPLHWEKHHVLNNGWNGFTATGVHVVYVHQPVDLRYEPRRIHWSVFLCWGANPDRDGGYGALANRKGARAQYATVRSAKAAAQRYWKREVLALLKTP